MLMRSISSTSAKPTARAVQLSLMIAAIPD
jgi:hypothetical protein